MPTPATITVIPFAIARVRVCAPGEGRRRCSRHAILFHLCQVTKPLAWLDTGSNHNPGTATDRYQTRACSSTEQRQRSNQARSSCANLPETVPNRKPHKRRSRSHPRNQYLYSPMNGDNFLAIARDMGTSISQIDATYGHVPRPVSQASSDRLAQLLYGT